MEERWRITVDRGVCQGTGMCVAIAPACFRLEDGKSRPVEDAVSPDDLVIDAADTCPTEAITVRDAGGRQLAP